MSNFRLQVFRQVAWSLSFTKAARELSISQPAVTKHIRELESQYGTRLFDRIGSRIALTPAGKVLLEHCHTILTDYDRLEHAMHLLEDRQVGSLRIGASLTIAQYILPQFLAQFGQRYPEIGLDLQMHNSGEIEALLQERKIDIGLVEGPSREPDLKYTPFLRDEIVAVVRNGVDRYPDSISAEALTEIPLVLRERTSGTTRFIEEALRAQGIRYDRLRVRLHMGSTESIKSFLEYADDVTLLSVYAVRKELAAGLFRLIDFQDFTIERDFCFVQQQGDTMPINRLFSEFVMTKAVEIYGRRSLHR